MKDITFLGGGPAGYVGTIRAAKLGANVCIIEADSLGGTCLNRGCIPTKALYRNAEIIKLIKDSHYFGIEAQFTDINVKRVQERKQEVVETLVSGIKQLLKKNKIEVIKGTGKIIDKNTIKVTGNNDDITEIKTKHIVIATGSKPFIPKVTGFNNDNILTTEQLLEFKEVPQRLVIVGGGVIGMEFACIMTEFGSKVTVVELMKNILPTVDSSISKRMKVMLKKKGINILTDTKVTKVCNEKGEKVVTIEDKKGQSQLLADVVLVSTGREPNVDNLGLDALDINYDNKGIKVDDNYETSIKGIYAVGDVNGQIMLAHAASYQAIKAVEHILTNEPVNNSPIPSCIFTFPEIACVGLTEDQAKNEGRHIISSQFLFGANGKALTLGEGEGFIKVIADKDTEKIVGVHIIGPHASDLIHEGVLAVQKEMTPEDFRDTIHAHPTLGEAFHEAVMGLIGEAIHKI